MKTRGFALITLLAAAAVLLTGCASAAFAQTETPPACLACESQPQRTMTVSGSGKVYLTPDVAYVTIGVHSENYDAKKAVADNNASAQQVIAAIKGMGVEAKDIQTTNFSIYPQQEYDDQGKPTGKIKYVVDNSVYVTVRDLAKIGDVLNQSVQSGANSISGIQFDVADKTSAETEARKAAVNDAAAKAKELADAAGVTLGPIQTINESVSGTPIPQYRLAAAPMAADSSVPVEAGQMVLTIDVNIVYQIQ
jgi:uncharacterized protein YggE